MLSSYCPKNQQLQAVQFSTLALNALEIKIIDKISPSLYFITELYINNNYLLSLNGIQQFHNLEIFSFNFNNISVFSNLELLKNKFFLRKLSYIGNPIQSDTRSDLGYLKKHMFTRLQQFNSIDSLTKYSQSRSSAKKRKNLSESIQFDSNEETERQMQKLHTETYYRTLKSKNRKKTPALNTSCYSGSAYQLFDNKIGNPSTTHEPENSLQYLINQTIQYDPSFRHHHSRDTGVYVEPFEDGEQSESQPHGTARFSKREEKEWTSQKRLAFQILDEQKEQIADAYYQRYLKEKLFFHLKQEAKQGKAYPQAQLRKSWVKLRIAGAIGSLLHKYRRWI